MQANARLRPRAEPLISRIWILALSLSFLGCGQDSLREINAPEQLTLFSIDGRDASARQMKPVPTTGEKFQDFDVIGKVEIADPKQQKRLIAALKDGYNRRPEGRAKCFWPRHGIRATEKGHTVEFVICFQCLTIEEFVDGKSILGGSINGDIRPVLDQPLNDAGIPIAPP